MLPSEYWISELAGLSGVSTRTIRYYIQEGLLPQPEIRGKYAVFTDEYMHRLRLIKLLKDAYLPLNKIREILDVLDDNQILPLLEEFEKDPVNAFTSLQALPVFDQAQSTPLVLNRPEDNALSYIHSLREKEPEIKSAPAGQVHRYRQVPPPAPRFTEEWQRIPLAPGLELHVRQPVRPRLQRLIDQVIELFNQQNPFHREE